MRKISALLVATALSVAPAGGVFAADTNAGGKTVLGVGVGADTEGKAKAETNMTGRGHVDPTGKPSGANANSSGQVRSSAGTNIGRGEVDPTGKATGKAQGNADYRASPASGIGRGNVDPTGGATGAAIPRADLGKLNAAHASLTGRTEAASTSAVGQIRHYEEAKMAALAMPQDTPAQREARAAAIARANALLEPVANKPVTPGLVAQVDSILGIKSTM